MAALAACAHVEAPPGGPEDRDPPGVLTTRPANEAVVPTYDGPVVFVLDERISERGVAESVNVSPRTSPVEVRGGRDEVRVSLRGGWEPGHIYHVSLGQEIRDLFGNALAERTTLVFSTGPAIPSTTSTGSVTDRLTGRDQPNVRIEAIRVADSLVYAVPTDSMGEFVIDRVPAGDYQIRAYDDTNRNRSLELFEPRDSAFVTIAEGRAEDVALRLLLPDSTPPVARSAQLQFGRVLVEFDDNLDPEQTLDATSVSITSATGAAVEIGTVSVGFPPVANGAPGGAAPDTATGVARLPAPRLFIELADSVALEPDAEYTVRISGIRNVNGLTAEVEETFSTPPAPPAAAAAFPAVGRNATLGRLAPGRPALRT